MDKVKEAIKNQTVKSFTFVWMQGERDAREGHGLVYEKSLKALYEQLCTDLNTQNIYFVIGRLSDFDMQNKKYPHWTMIREIQVAFAATDKRFDWIDTDDLNDGLLSNGRKKENGLHMSVEGYHKMGKRFAEKALSLIRNE